ANLYNTPTFLRACNTMLSNDMIMGMFFLFHTGMGILGNLLLLLMYIYIFLICPQQKQPMVLIFLHLSVTNIMTLFSKVIPLAVKYFEYRELALCTTCLLSMVQALTISHSKSRGTWVKDRTHKNTKTFLLTFWVIDSLICIRLVPFINAIKYASGYIVFFLYRHQKNIQHRHRNNFSSRASHETRVIRIVLLLMICFVVFYLSNSYHSLYLSTMKKKHQLLENISDMFSSCYSVFCPFLLIGRESRILSPNSILMKWRNSSRPK
ncbi:hypothetical protein HPG69_007614, partial [Diceros bicornis minor]